MESEHWIGKVTQKAFIRRGNKILVVSEADTGEWGIPGGRLHRGEDPLSGLVREIKEETGLDVEVEEIMTTGIFIYLNDEPVFGVFYNARPLDENQPLVLDATEITDARWISLEEIDDIPFMEKFAPFIRKAFTI